MKCIQCKKDFDSQRKTAKFCSTKCRVANGREVSVTEVSVTPTDNVYTKPSPQADSVTPEILDLVRKGEIDPLTDPRTSSDRTLWKKAHKLTVKEYLTRGHFGGKRSKTSIEYFPFKDIMVKLFTALRLGKAL